MPVVVSEHADAAKSLATEELAFYEAIPSYAKVIAREGVDRAADIAAVGRPDAIRKQLQRYRDAGATDLVLSSLRSDTADPELLWEVAASI